MNRLIADEWRLLIRGNNILGLFHCLCLHTWSFIYARSPLDNVLVATALAEHNNKYTSINQRQLVNHRNVFYNGPLLSRLNLGTNEQHLSRTGRVCNDGHDHPSRRIKNSSNLITHLNSKFFCIFPVFGTNVSRIWRALKYVFIFKLKTMLNWWGNIFCLTSDWSDRNH